MSWLWIGQPKLFYSRVVKRKRQPEAETVVSPEILEQAKVSLTGEEAKRAGKCVVCGGECAPNSTEGLCWVCRRLKLSAWHAEEGQIAAQE